MKHNKYTFEELYNVVYEKYKTLSDSESYNVSLNDIEELKETLSTFPRSLIRDNKHVVYETAEWLPAGILGLREDLKSPFPIIVLVKENDAELLFEYDKFGNRKMEDGTVASPDDKYKLYKHFFYFENGDYVANNDVIGILEDVYHNKYSFAKNLRNGEEMYGWFLNEPARLCNDEEKKIIDKCIENKKSR